MISVYHTFNPADAQLVRSRLEAAGFHALVTHETSSLAMEGYSLATGGILVQVPASEAEDALALLKSEQES